MVLVVTAVVSLVVYISVTVFFVPSRWLFFPPLFFESNELGFLVSLSLSSRRYIEVAKVVEGPPLTTCFSLALF